MCILWLGGQCKCLWNASCISLKAKTKQFFFNWTVSFLFLRNKKNLVHLHFGFRQLIFFKNKQTSTGSGRKWETGPCHQNKNRPAKSCHCLSYSVGSRWNVHVFITNSLSSRGWNIRPTILTWLGPRQRPSERVFKLHLLGWQGYAGMHVEVRVHFEGVCPFLPSCETQRSNSSQAWFPPPLPA